MILLYDSQILLPRTATPKTIIPPNSTDSTIPKTSLFPVDQMSLDSISTPKDFSTDTMTVAMMPAANPTLYKEYPLCAKCTWVERGGKTKPITSPTARAIASRITNGRSPTCIIWVMIGERLVPYRPI